MNQGRSLPTKPGKDDRILIRGNDVLLFQNGGIGIPTITIHGPSTREVEKELRTFIRSISSVVQIYKGFICDCVKMGITI